MQDSILQLEAILPNPFPHKTSMDFLSKILNSRNGMKDILN
jgi:hypothetical protein